MTWINSFTFPPGGTWEVRSMIQESGGSTQFVFDSNYKP